MKNMKKMKKFSCDVSPVAIFVVKTTGLKIHKISHSGEQQLKFDMFSIWVFYVKVSSHCSHLKCIPSVYLRSVNSSVIKVKLEYTHGDF